jgi:hypothetical protein
MVVLDMFFESCEIEIFKFLSGHFVKGLHYNLKLKKNSNASKVLLEMHAAIKNAGNFSEDISANVFYLWFADSLKRCCFTATKERKPF